MAWPGHLQLPHWSKLEGGIWFSSWSCHIQVLRNEDEFKWIWKYGRQIKKVLGTPYKKNWWPRIVLDILEDKNAASASKNIDKAMRGHCCSTIPPLITTGFIITHGVYQTAFKCLFNTCKSNEEVHVLKEKERGWWKWFIYLVISYCCYEVWTLSNKLPSRGSYPLGANVEQRWNDAEKAIRVNTIRRLRFMRLFTF